MVPNFDDIGLLVIDVQERLMGAMDEAIAARTINNIDILAELVGDCGGSRFYTEQYPKGLGPTVSVLKARLDDAARFEKIAFSCCGDERFLEQAFPELPQDLIIVGAETHVCVLQTVIDLLFEDEDEERCVYVPIDGVCSRRKLHWKNGLEQMAEAGAILTTTETLVFQALGEATGDRFKHYSQRIR